MPTLFAFDRATFGPDPGDPAVRDLSWRVNDGETWAIVGPTGSGKSTLAEAVRGRHQLSAGTLTGPIFDGGDRPDEAIRLVAFKEPPNAFSYARHYYQERFNLRDPDNDVTLDQFLRGGGDVSDEEIGRLTTSLGVAPLRSHSFVTLSNGQTRRARIAKALLGRPVLVILDDPFLGLDAAGRADLVRHLDGVRRDGTNLILVARAEELPPGVTHVIELGRADGVWAGPRGEWKAFVRPPVKVGQPLAATGLREPVVELKDVRVRHAGRTILDGVTWTVRAGERWALTGPNGAGKSTLLSLIYGDHPQAYSNDVKLFGVPRGSGESIWDVRKRIGFVSSEFHLYFSEPLTAAATAATGFSDGLVARPTTAAQDETVRARFDEFGLAAVADRPFARLSTGQQRLVLLIRALVKRPELLLLDEPFQGLDAATVGRARDWLDRHLTPNQTMIFVGHDPGEIPRGATLARDLGRTSRD